MVAVYENVYATLETVIQRLRREPKVVVAVRLDQIDVEYLDRIADEHDANRSDVIRFLIAEHQTAEHYSK